MSKKKLDNPIYTPKKKIKKSYDLPRDDLTVDDLTVDDLTVDDLPRDNSPLYELPLDNLNDNALDIYNFDRNVFERDNFNISDFNTDYLNPGKVKKKLVKKKLGKPPELKSVSHKIQGKYSTCASHALSRSICRTFQMLTIIDGTSIEIFYTLIYLMIQKLFDIDCNKGIHPYFIPNIIIKYSLYSH